MLQNPVPNVFRDPIGNTITIYGYITNNDNPIPAFKPNGKPVDPDPLSRICNRNKKQLLKENDVCIFYHINRNQDFDGHYITTISFMFSNTGPKAIKLRTDRDKELFEELSSNWKTVISTRVANDIEDYIDTVFSSES